MDDSQIIELYFKREEIAIQYTQEKYANMLKKISYNILCNLQDSEECVNDTYEKVWESIPPQKPIYLGAYLAKIVRNISINKWRSTKTQKRNCGVDLLLSEMTDCIPSTQSIEKEIEQAEITEIINSWLHSLSKDDRVLFMKRYWFGESLKNLSIQFFSTENKISGKLFRLRQKLKTILEIEKVQI
ncbi:MAG: sigma-70 family RNA polymerase sigma factor [Oscillospiraceae bacterium]